MTRNKKLVRLMALTVATATVASAVPAQAAFDAAFYAKQNPDVVAVVGTTPKALEAHYNQFGKNEGRAASANDVSASPIRQLFDAEFYAKQYPDVVAVYGNDADSLFKHFMLHGMNELRQINPYFDVVAYKNAYPDLAAVYGNDIASYYIHFVTFGQTEHRTLGGFPAEKIAPSGVKAATVASSSGSSGGSSGGASSSGSGSAVVPGANTAEQAYETAKAAANSANKAYQEAVSAYNKAIGEANTELGVSALTTGKPDSSTGVGKMNSETVAALNVVENAAGEGSKKDAAEKIDATNTSISKAADALNEAKKASTPTNVSKAQELAGKALEDAVEAVGAANTNYDNAKTASEKANAAVEAAKVATKAAEEAKKQAVASKEKATAEAAAYDKMIADGQKMISQASAQVTAAQENLQKVSTEQDAAYQAAKKAAEVALKASNGANKDLLDKSKELASALGATEQEIEEATTQAKLNSLIAEKKPAGEQAIENEIVAAQQALTGDPTDEGDIGSKGRLEALVGNVFDANGEVVGTKLTNATATAKTNAAKAVDAKLAELEAAVATYNKLAKTDDARTADEKEKVTSILEALGDITGEDVSSIISGGTDKDTDYVYKAPTKDAIATFKSGAKTVVGGQISNAVSEYNDDLKDLDKANGKKNDYENKTTAVATAKTTADDKATTLEDAEKKEKAAKDTMEEVVGEAQDALDAANDHLETVRADVNIGTDDDQDSLMGKKAAAEEAAGKADDAIKAADNAEKAAKEATDTAADNKKEADAALEDATNKQKEANQQATTANAQNNEAQSLVATQPEPTPAANPTNP